MKSSKSHSAPRKNSIQDGRNISRPVTLKDIARVAGLSVPAVSLSLLENPRATVKVGAATKQKVLKIAQKLGYRTNLAAQALSKGKSASVGIITFHTAPVYSFSHIGELRNSIARAKLTPFLYHVDRPSDEAAEEACNAMIDARVAGVLLYLPFERLRGPAFASLKRFGIPMVSVGGSLLDGIPRYLPNERQGFCLIAEHLIAEGYRNIGLVTYRNDESSVRDLGSSLRIEAAVQGYQDALRHAKADGRKIASKIHRLNLSVFGNQPPTVAGIDEHFAIGYLAMRGLIERRELPEALIFQADGKALGALRACAEAGIRVPQDLAITGFNDDRNCSAGMLTLTSVALPIKEMMRLASTELIERINGEVTHEENEAIPLPCRLAVRQSTSKRKLPPLDIDFNLQKFLG